MADDASQASAAAPGGSGGGAHQLAPAEQGLRCPRCDSPNTKFCYYNNYSLAQPRHYCKTCRRYWTKGGALRNVPVGGGCRKNKRSKSSSSSTTSSRLSLDNFSSDGSTSESGGAAGLKFLTSLPSLGVLPFSSRAAAAFGDHMISPLSASSAAPLLGLNNYPVSAVGVYTDVGHANNSIASSIESLSSINQELHWKLQQQRLAMFGSGVSAPLAAPYLENQQDAIIQLEPTNYAMHSTSIATSAADTTMTMAINNSTGSNNAGMWSSTATPWPAWSEMPQFGTL